MEALLNQYAARGDLRVLLLGVTPELACLQWPEGTQLLAVDRSEGMIRHVWPADRLNVNGQVVRGDWNTLPLPDSCCDVVIGDGFYTPLTYPADYRRLGSELVRVLRPGGLYLIRAFIRPGEAETSDAIESDMLAGRIGSIHALKWRLAMLLHEDLLTGVSLTEVWRLWDRFRRRPGIAAALERWPREEVATLDAYRDADSHYTFPTLTELRNALRSDFTERACRLPAYELGERCPVLLLERR